MPRVAIDEALAPEARQARDRVLILHKRAANVRTIRSSWLWVVLPFFQ